MNDIPSHDPQLLDLKRVAEAGSDQGHHFDLGTLAVIEEIVNEKHFVRHQFSSRILATARERQQDPGSTIYEDVKGFLKSNGWTLDQGVQYARGIEYAESELEKFRVVDNNQDERVHQGV